MLNMFMNYQAKIIRFWIERLLLSTKNRGLTGADVKLNVQSLYTKQIKLIGSTGGTRNELRELIDIATTDGLKVKVWKKLKLDNVKEALQGLFAKDRDGRILLEVT